MTEASGPIRVAIVDDHPVMRDGTAALLAKERDIEVRGTGASLADARAFLAADDIDVLILDVQLRAASGLAALDPLLHRPAVIMFTAFDLPQYAEAAMRLGASGFVPKSAPLGELVEAVRRVAGGGVWFAVRPAARVPLTGREFEVLALVAEGRSNDEIAGALAIATATVETHLRRMFQRTGAASRTELALRAVREGWLDIPHSD
jgi:DNA-binding NarL/FixJ family response regulator